MFRVGQKVVCIRGTILCPCLRQDKIYTCLGFDRFGLMIVDCYDGPHSWFKDRFRPIVERKTDITIFKALLTPSKERVNQ